MKLIPLGTRVLIEIKREETKTASGIIISVADKGEKTSFAVVKAVGDEVEKVKVDDRVMFDKFATLPLDDDTAIVDESDIIAICEEEKE